MAAATDDVYLVDDLDVIQAFDLDLLDDDEFRGGSACESYYSAIFSDADIVSHCRHACEDGDGGDRAQEEVEVGSSPVDSGVTDDGPLEQAAGDDDAAAEAMSAYVAELERFLLQDNDDNDDAACGEQVEDVLALGVVDDYFAGDQLLATAEAVSATGRTESTDGEEEENGDVLAAGEDEQLASRKRARNKIKGTAMQTPWGELEVMNLTMMHLAQIQVPPAAFRMWPSGLIA